MGNQQRKPQGDVQRLSKSHLTVEESRVECEHTRNGGDGNLRKNCIKCNRDLELSKFSVRTERKHDPVDHIPRYSSSCKECQSLMTRLKYYGITKQEFEELRESHNDCCAICGMSEEDAWNKKTKHYGLYIDHCHLSGEIRGLLCHSCNLIIGHAKDNIERLKSATSYLESF